LALYISQYRLFVQAHRAYEISNRPPPFPLSQTHVYVRLCM